MKKQLLKLASLALLATVLPVTIQSVGEFSSRQLLAATQVNFDQDSLSDEAYVRHILTQFNELDGYRSEMIDELTGGSTVTVYDRASAGTKVETVIAASEYNEEMTLLNYVYDDGTTVSDEVAYLESSVSYMSDLYPDYEAQVEELREQVGKALVLTPPVEGLEVEGANNMFLTEALEFTAITKEGDVVKATIDFNSYTVEHPDMAALYPEGTQFSMMYTIDPATASVTSTLTIDIDEEALAAESSEDELGISVASLLSDTTVNVVTTATDEKVPALDELTTITEADFQEIVSQIGLEYY